ncbi:hypothetical protein BDY19DRAFT_996545 [Irpex rosettiformis]|uniref:Uncharacterized protein n=1 Tax=Irpex rosettiformis TaxID=378272 RepID=A0ACB8TUJ1_9APHY|nr:hypothetical protein BDY19DRAFT_996545 [Irpex rosettiformis]
MLKRQRTSSPLPWSKEPTIEVDVTPGDLYEPDHKRRRYFTASHLDKSLLTDSFNDGLWEGESNDVEDRPRKREDGSSVNEWQLQAGQYKDANTILHELHAEQRHRMLFAVGSSTHAASHGSSLHVAAQGSAPRFHHSDAVGTLNGNEHELPPRVEAKRVAERYEDTNKLLASVFLSRRRQRNETASENTSIL